VRIHKFGEMDDDAPEGCRGNTLPSYTAMCEMATQDTEVSGLLAQEAFASAAGDLTPTDGESALKLGECAGQQLSADVVRLALRAFGIRVGNNLVTGKVEISGLPPMYSQENAANTLPVFLLDRLRAIGVKGVNKTAIADYLANICDENRQNPITDLLKAVTWDGCSRFSMLGHILGLSPDSLESILVRKWLIQCVALAHNSIQQQDGAEGVLTLQGPQGAGKTMFFRRLALKNDWFAEGVTLDLRNKDDLMKATGAWITELGELDETLRREQTSLKAFITSPVDRIRVPYARESTITPRRASFCASVNPREFLKDTTGDRRFWVVPVKLVPIQELLALGDEWFIQLWAEVYTLWKANPQGYRLTVEERQKLEQSNRQFREALRGEEEIRQAFNFNLPPGQWAEYSASQVRTVLCSSLFGQVSTRQIGRVLAKLEREDTRITSRTLHGYQIYRIPLLKTPLTVLLPSAEGHPT